MKAIHSRSKAAQRLAPWLLLLVASVAPAACPENDGAPPPTPIPSYPRTSDQYAVEYQVGGGAWTDARVYMSLYGATNASLFRNDSGYAMGATSMSFVSIPARPDALVQIRVTKLADGPFRVSDRVSVRPSPKAVGVQTLRDGTVQLSTRTVATFDGEQFILWWNRGADGGGVEGLAFFLNPPYARPSGTNVQIVTAPGDLLDAYPSNIDTLDFEGTVAIGSTGDKVYTVPASISTIFLGSDAWVQGKLRFDRNVSARIYGPGVLDNSRFSYLNRNCVLADGTPTDDGLYSLSSKGSGANGLSGFIIDGIIISDQNHAANDALFSSVLNNVKTLGWNSNNAAWRLNDATTASNLFVRSGDDSLMIWGSGVNVTNATVWQGYNGGVVSLGWSNNSAGDYNRLDGLFVVKTDWQRPTTQSWTALSQPGPPDPLASQNNAVFASLMVPSTMYGTKSPPVFRNIFVEDPPQVLFSLKIDPSVNCPPGFCDPKFLKQSSSVSLKIENLYSPQSLIENSIGFETLPAGYIDSGDDTVSHFPTDYTLTGSMHVDLTNVLIRLPIGIVLPLVNGLDPTRIGRISTNGADVSVNYSLAEP